MKRVAALKVLPRESMRSKAAVERFFREAEAAARLSHVNIVTAYDAGEARGTHYLVMEYVDGGDLSTIIRQRGRLPIPEAVDYITQAARGLAYAHQHGVIHRDIKPSNMLLSREGVVKLLDMGLALLHEEDGTRPEISITGEGRLLGTAEYMAPEQAVHAHDADHRSDIYSLGCTLYRLISGATPYSGRSTMEMVLAHREKPIRMLRDAASEVPEALEALYIQMVAKRPADRFQSMDDVVLALEELVATGRVPRFDKPKSLSRGDVSMSPAPAIPIARSKRKKEPEPEAEPHPSPYSIPAVTQHTTQASDEEEVVAVVDASNDGRQSLSETTSGADAMLIDAMSMAGSAAVRRPARANTTTSKSHRTIAMSAVAAALIAIVVFAITGGTTQQEAQKDAVSPIATDGGKDAAAKDRSTKDAASVTPVASKEEWLDLLPLTDVTKDRVAGNWRKADGGGVAGGVSTNDRIAMLTAFADARNQILAPVEVTGDYDLSVIVQPFAGNRFTATLPVGPSHATFHFVRGTSSALIGFEVIDGKPFHVQGNPSYASRSDIDFRAPLLFDFSVRINGENASLAAKIGGRQVSAWQGPVSALSTHADWKIAQQGRRIQFGSNLDPSTTLTISKATLTSLGGVAKPLRTPASGETVKLTITKPKEFTAGGGMVEGLALTGGGTFLISSTFDKSVKAWDLKPASPTSTKLAEVDRCHVVTMSPDDQFVAAACNSKYAYVYNAGQKDPLVHQLGPLAGFVWGVAYTDKTTLVGSTREGSLMAWNLAASPVVSKPFGEHGSECMGVHVSRDRKLLASCGGNATMGNVKIWDAKTSELKREIKEHKSTVHAVDFVQPAGRNKQVITASHDGALKLFDAVTGDFVRQFSGHSGQVWNVVTHPSDRAAFSCGSDGTVRAWDLQTGLELWNEKLGSGGVHGLALSGDGKVLAAGGHDGKVRIYAVDVALPPSGR